MIQFYLFFIKNFPHNKVEEWSKNRDIKYGFSMLTTGLEVGLELVIYKLIFGAL